MPTADERQLASNLRDLGYTGDTQDLLAIYQFLFGFDAINKAQRIRTEINERHRAPKAAVPHWQYHFDEFSVREDSVTYALDQTIRRLRAD